MAKFTIPQDILELSRDRAPNFHKLLHISQPEWTESGQIWSTRSVFELPDGRRFETDQPRLVVILDGDVDLRRTWDQISVAPASPAIEFAADFDLIVPQSSSPLDFSFMAEVWNETPVVAGHLRQYLGKLPAAATNALERLYSCHLQDENSPSELESWVGIPVGGMDDERLRFQEAEIQAVTYLAMAATAALSLVNEAATQIEPEAGEERRWNWVFEVKPKLEKLSLALRRTNTAYAAGHGAENMTFVIEVAEKAEYFAGELLCSRQRPYKVYVVVHKVSPGFQDHICQITIRSASAIWTSHKAYLRPQTQIKIGEDSTFKRELVESVSVQIE